MRARIAATRTWLTTSLSDVLLLGALLVGLVAFADAPFSNALSADGPPPGVLASASCLVLSAVLFGWLRFASRAGGVLLAALTLFGLASFLAVLLRLAGDALGGAGARELLGPPAFEAWMLGAMPALSISLTGLLGLVARGEQPWADQAILSLASTILAVSGVDFALLVTHGAAVARAASLGGSVGSALAFAMMALGVLGWRRRGIQSSFFSAENVGWRAVRICLPLAVLVPADRFILAFMRPLLSYRAALQADILLSVTNLAAVAVLFNLAIWRLARDYQSLARKEARLALAIEAPGAGSFDWDLRNGTLDWTPNAEMRIGLAPGGMRTLDQWRAMLDPDDRRVIEQRIAAAAARRSDHFTFRYRLNAVDGEVHTFEGSGRCFYDEAGALIRVVGMNLDVTERDERQAELETNQAQLRSIIENVPDAMIVVDEQGAIRRFNPAAERMFGFAADAMRDRDVGTLMPPELAHWPAGEIARYLRSGAPGMVGRAVTLTARRAGGEVFPIELTVGEAWSRDARIFIAFVRDISERVSAEQRLEALRDEYAHSARLTAMGEIAAGLAHELNQPLAAGTNFLGAAEMIVEQDIQDPELAKLLAAARGQLLRAGEIIRRLRDFLAKGSADLRIEPVETTIRDAIALGLVGNHQHQIDVDYTVAPGADHMLADRVQVQQVLVNLLRNSAEAVRDLPRARRRITISARVVDDEALELCVVDEGPGFPKATLADFHMPFVSTKGDEGMGIGLSICKRIVEAHGGMLTATNRASGGASIAFTLPRPQMADAGGMP
ncbi:PAS domain S-box protein [Sphingomonas sp. MMS12-HWE2-04]|uniref:PAS domain S-box protein n=1 Tax=Sphingomonas sp. MMS12-HWE2-04 TaxID=3234199 RepID=UPI00384D6001